MLNAQKNRIIGAFYGKLTELFSSLTFIDVSKWQCQVQVDTATSLRIIRILENFQIMVRKIIQPGRWLSRRKTILTFFKKYYIPGESKLF